MIAARSVDDGHPAVKSAHKATISDSQSIETTRIDLAASSEAADRIGALLQDGITHVVLAAGVDGTIEETGGLAEALKETRGAKVRGTGAVMRASAAFPQVGIVLVSSGAGHLGLPGAAAYAVANAEAEDLILEARARGQRAAFVAVGPVRDTGMANTAGSDQWHRFGVRLLEPDLLAKTVATALYDPLAFPPSLLVDVDWAAARPFLAYGEDGRMLANLLQSGIEARAEPQPGTVAASGGLDSIAAQPLAVQQEAVRALVSECVAGVLGVPDPATLRRDIGLNEIGLDSLTAVDLAARLSRETGLVLPPTMAFDHPTIGLLAEAILRQGHPAAKTERSPAPAERLVTQPVNGPDLAALAAMSDAEAWSALVTEDA